MSDYKRRETDVRIDEIEAKVEGISKKIDALSASVETMVLIFEKGSGFLWVLKAFGRTVLWVAGIVAAFAGLMAAIKYGGTK